MSAQDILPILVPVLGMTSCLVMTLGICTRRSLRGVYERLNTLEHKVANLSLPTAQPPQPTLLVPIPPAAATAPSYPMSYPPYPYTMARQGLV